MILRAAVARAESLRRRVVGIAAGGVVGRVQDLADGRRERPDRLLDALLERDVRSAAALASAAQPQEDGVALDVDQLDPAAVAGDRRVDLAVQKILNRPLQIAL